MQIPEDSRKVSLLTGSQETLNCGPPVSLTTMGGAHVTQYTLANQTFKTDLPLKEEEGSSGCQEEAG